MKEQVLTLVAAKKGGLKAAHVERARELLDKAVKGEPLWLAKGRAVDIFFKGDFALPPKEFPEIDCCIQPREKRRKKLLISDMDSTIIKQETLDEIAGMLGLKAKVAPITERAMRGEIEFAAALKERVELIKGTPFNKVKEVLKIIELMPGAKVLVKTMRRHRARCVLVSGGFDFVTGFVAEKVGFHAHYSNHLKEVNGILNGTVRPPILDKRQKEKILVKERDGKGLMKADTLAIGDGANDIPMIEAAGLGIAFHAKPKVQEAAKCRINHGDLTTALYFQGYREEEIVE